MFYSRLGLQSGLREPVAALLDDAYALETQSAGAQVLRRFLDGRGLILGNFGAHVMVTNEAGLWYGRFLDQNTSKEAFRVSPPRTKSETAEVGYFLQDSGERVIVSMIVACETAQNFAEAYAKADPADARYAARVVGMEVLMAAVLRGELEKQDAVANFAEGTSPGCGNGAVPLLEQLQAVQGAGFSFILPEA